MTPLDSASWTSPAKAPASRPVAGPAGQRHVHHHDQHQIDRDGAADDEPRQRGLQRERQRDGQDDPGGLHSGSPSAASGAGVGVSTTSTSSSAREVDRRPDHDALVGAAALLHRLDPADDEALGIDAVDARRHDDVADDDVGRPRTRSPCCSRSSPRADDHALRARALDRARRPRRCGRSAAAPSPRARSARRPGRRRRPARSPPCRRCRPSRVPLSIVTRPEVGRRRRADDVGGRGRSSGSCSRSSSSRSRPRVRSRQRALLLQRDLRRGELPLQLVVLRLARAAGRRSRSTGRGRPTTPPDSAALHFGEDAEGHRLEHRHAASASSPARRSG